MKTLKDLILKKLVLNRRKNKRFKVQDKIFVVFEPCLIKKKQIVNISIGGLSYVDEENHSTRSLKLNILSGNSLYFYDKVSYIPVPRSEMVCHTENSKKTNLHAVQFIGLKHSQKSQLKNFIQAHSTGVV